MIEKTLAAWKESSVDKIVVVVRPDDGALGDLCRACGAEVVVPQKAPAEMRDSVQCGLRHIEARFSPTADDAWLLAPADMPKLSPRVIDAAIAAHDPARPALLVPTLDGQRGHPVLFPWRMAHEVFSLGQGEGLDVLRKRHECREIPCDKVEPEGKAVFSDIDTPEDYERIA